MTEEHDCIPDYEKTIAHIEKYGLSVIIVAETEYLPAFAYSIGLWQKFRHPEIICLGMKQQDLHATINNVAEIVKRGESIATGRVYDDFFNDEKGMFVQVDSRNLPDYFGAAIGYYQSRDFPALQLVWTENQKFPWEEGFNEKFTF